MKMTVGKPVVTKPTLSEGIGPANIASGVKWLLIHGLITTEYLRSALAECDTVPEDTECMVLQVISDAEEDGIGDTLANFPAGGLQVNQSADVVEYGANMIGVVIH